MERRGASNRTLRVLLVGVASLVLGMPLSAQTSALETMPDNPDPAARYVFYLHGRIIETSGRRPTHPAYGIYEYDGVLEALGRSGLHIISEHRPPDTEVSEYARKVAGQIRSLLTKGVPPDHIGVVGFSKGGLIAISVSSILGEPINYVFLAACSDMVLVESQIRVSGRVLSVFEETDEIGVSCMPLIDRSPAVVEANEVRISTGARHGAFYTPREVWLAPTLEWLGREGR